MNLLPNYDYLYKIVLLGDATVGKTNLVVRFTENNFSLNITPTVGYDYKSKTIFLDKYNKKQIYKFGIQLDKKDLWH